MKREYTLVQVKCDKIVTSAMPLSQHESSKDSKNRIKFLFSFTAAVQAAVCDLFDLVLLGHIA